jgi:hypothetical protein
MSFVIVNNMLTPSIRATNLGISSRVTITTIWNNFENLEDESFNMKHLERCSYTILESPFENKWGTVVKAWVNKVLFRTIVCSG